MTNNTITYMAQEIAKNNNYSPYKREFNPFNSGNTRKEFAAEYLRVVNGVLRIKDSSIDSYNK